MGFQATPTVIVLSTSFRKCFFFFFFAWRITLKEYAQNSFILVIFFIFNQLHFSSFLILKTNANSAEICRARNLEAIFQQVLLSHFFF